MNIQDFATTPTLIEIKLDTESLVEKYGEPITFYAYDIVPMSTYFSFFDAQSENKFEHLEKMMRNLILDKKGKRVLKDDQDLPIDIAAAAINKIGELMGKSVSKTSTSKVGEPVT